MHPRPSCPRRLLLTLAALAASFAPAPADAAVTLAIQPTFPATLTVGQRGAASIAFVNASTGPEAMLPVRVTTVYLSPSCGGPVAGNAYCPAALADPAVFALAGPGMGRAATGCQGVTFAISLPLPGLGVYQLTPTTPFQLAIPGSAGYAYTCIIDFGVTAVALPTHDANLAAPGLQTDAIAAVTGSTSAPSTGSAMGVSETTLAVPTPTPPLAPTTPPAPTQPPPPTPPPALPPASAPPPADPCTAARPVTASLTLRVRPLGGDRIQFTGALHGRPGCRLGAANMRPLVLIEARNGRHWQSVGVTARVSPSGAYKVIYRGGRGGSIGGKFQFRAVAPSSALFPRLTSRVRTALVR